MDFFFFQRERQRDRETERQRDRETERQRQRQTDRQRDGETKRQRDRDRSTSCCILDIFGDRTKLWRNIAN